jgi:PhnB protein
MADGHQQSTSISVMLIVPDAEAAVTWYKDALDATELWNLGGVAGLEIDGAPFYLHEVNPSNVSEDSPGRLGVTSTRIELLVDDPDAVMNRAIAAGASLRSDVQDHQVPWGITAKAFAIRSAITGLSATGLRFAAKRTEHRSLAR